MVFGLRWIGFIRHIAPDVATLAHSGARNVNLPQPLFPCIPFAITVDKFSQKIAPPAPPAWTIPLNMQQCEVGQPFTGPLRKAIHSLKYQQNMGLGILLAAPMSTLLDKLQWQVDIITAVPLSRQRITERGYNQSYLLARPIALTHRIPFIPQAIKRTRNTPSQVGLNAPERKINVADAFSANPEIVKNKSVLLIDDVATTGATLSASTQALLSAGAKHIYALTLARAVFKNSNSGGEQE